MNFISQDQDIVVESYPPDEYHDAISNIYSLCSPDSLIAFGCLRDDKILPFSIVRNSDLDEILPDIYQAADSTLYFSGSVFGNDALEFDYALYLDQLSTGKIETPLTFNKSQSTTSELAFMTVDLDLYRGRKGQLEAPEAHSRLKQLVALGKVPKPSYSVFSGRGLYLIYMLIEFNGTAPRATANNKKLYSLVYGKLSRVLKDFGPDKRKSDCSSWLKCPNTMEIHYLPFPNSFPYKLGELSDACDNLIGTRVWNPPSPSPSVEREQKTNNAGKAFRKKRREFITSLILEGATNREIRERAKLEFPEMLENRVVLKRYLWYLRNKKGLFLCIK